MSENDELDAIKALTYRLTGWGIDGAADKARQYVGDLVARGWAMQANARPLRRPPTASEECPEHIGEWRDFCRACAANRKAATEEAALPDGRWTPERIRADVREACAQRAPEPDHPPLDDLAAPAVAADTERMAAAQPKEDA